MRQSGESGGEVGPRVATPPVRALSSSTQIPEVAISQAKDNAKLERLVRRAGRGELLEQQPLKGDLSRRRIYRLHLAGGGSVAGVVGPDREENRAFVGFTRIFLSLGLPVPELVEVDLEGGAYLLEDLGDTTLASRIAGGEGGAAGAREKRARLEQAVRDLVRFQTEAADALDTSLCYEGTHFDEAAWRRDQQLFLDHMAPMLPEAPIPAEALEQDFSRHRELLARWPGRHFLYRDFQPRNIMLTPDGMRYLDYQAGRLGHPAWDIAALTQSASSELEADEAAELRRLHARLLDEAGEVAEGEMEEAWPAYGLLRSLQSLGAHGRAARREVAGALDRAAVPLRQGLALIETHRELSGLHRLRDLLRALMQQVQAAEGQTEREEG